MGSVYILYREKQVTYGHGDSEKVRVIQTYETVKDRWISHHPYPAFESEEQAQEFIDANLKHSNVKIMRFEINKQTGVPKMKNPPPPPKKKL